MSPEGTEDPGVLPSQVRSRLAEMAALKSKPKKVYPDNIAHQVQLKQQKKESAVKEQDQEILHKRNQDQITEGLRCR